MLAVRLDRGDLALGTRFDRGALARPIRQTNGGVIYQGRVARTGDHSYPWGIERRDSAELSRISGQLAGIPVVASHPVVLLKDGGEAKTIGAVMRSWIDGMFAVVEMRIDADGVQEIKSGRSELSLGYQVEVDDRGNQSLTRVDHVALTSDSRCGPNCSIRSDGTQTDDACGCKNADSKSVLSCNLETAIHRQMLFTRR